MQNQQKEPKKIPDVFYLKPLNNWHAQETKILNNAVCRCNCQSHHEKNQVTLNQVEKNLWAKFKQKMVIRVKRIRIVIAIVGLICFALGISIPFLFRVGTKIDNEKQSLRRDFMGIKQRHRIPPPLPPFLKSTQHKLRNNSLQDVFISVKTTRKYHYPRLVIQLETWVSLVKSQVIFSSLSKNSNYLRTYLFTINTI